MKRLSSSIIRELSSNMLIPYTRLKLMECIGQGIYGYIPGTRLIRTANLRHVTKINSNVSNVNYDDSLDHNIVY